MTNRRPFETVIPRYGMSQDVLGLPPKAITFSNSERDKATCSLQWFFGYGERLSYQAKWAPRFGSAFHRFANDLYFWFAVNDQDYPGNGVGCVWCADSKAAQCLVCGGGKGKVRPGPLTLEYDRWVKELQESERFTRTEVDENMEKLSRTVYGYLQTWGNEPPKTIRLLDVELMLAAPIMEQDGSPFKSEITLIRDKEDIGGMWRMPTSNEPSDVERIKRTWPWYQVGTLDFLGVDRRTFRLWFGEHKTSAAPDNYLKGLTLDPQVAGYTWLLLNNAEAISERYKIELDTDNPVAGYLYDVASSSNQRDPKILKPTKANPGVRFSTAKGNIPSWAFLAACQQHGVDHIEYEDHIRGLRDRVDSKLYRREWGSVGRTEATRYHWEVLGVARRLAALRAAVEAGNDPASRAISFPRSPLCRKPGGYCAYSGPCTNDGPEARVGFEVSPGQRWGRIAEEQDEPKTGIAIDF